MKNYKEEEDFVGVYPFVPYQINLLQKVFDRIRQTGFSGKHLAKGERSMLNAFKEAAVEYVKAVLECWFHFICSITPWRASLIR